MAGAPLGNSLTPILFPANLTFSGKLKFSFAVLNDL